MGRRLHCSCGILQVSDDPSSTSVLVFFGSSITLMGCTDPPYTEGWRGVVVAPHQCPLGLVTSCSFMLTCGCTFQCLIITTQGGGTKSGASLALWHSRWLSGSGQAWGNGRTWSNMVVRLGAMEGHGLIPLFFLFSFWGSFFCLSF